MDKYRAPEPTTCQDSLALNYGEPEECRYAGTDQPDPSDEPCTTCNGTGTTTNGNGTTKFFGIKKGMWIWLILGAIVAYYLWQRGKR